MRETRAFGDPEHWRFDWDRFYSRDEWLDLLPTSGAFTRLPPDKLADLLDGAGAAIDAVGSGFIVRYTAVVVTAARTSG